MILKFTLNQQILSLKKKSLYLLCLVLPILAGLLWQAAPVSARADQDVLAAVSVTLWPEYDQPSVRVVYEIRLPETVNFPQEVIVPVPAEAEVQKVAIQRADGEQLPLAWDITMAEGRQNVRVMAVSPSVIVIYQDPGLEKSGASRKFTFEWLSTYRVESLTFAVYQPYGASTLETDPLLDRVDHGSGELAYYRGDFSAVGPGEGVSLKIQYIKDIANPDYPALSVSPASPVNETTSGHSATPISVVVWLVAVAMVVLILVAIYYGWFKRNMSRKREHIVQGVGILNPEKQAVFCHECGNRSKAGDSYCRSCGTELRRFS